MAALVVVTGVLLWGALTIPTAPADTFTIAALTDLVNQDPEILAVSEYAPEDFGTRANSPETSQAIFDLDAALTRQIADQRPDFVVWSENELADADDPHFMDQLKSLAAETGSYIVADVVWHAPTGMHDTALLASPQGVEVGRRAKINTTDGEENVGFVPGPREYPVFETQFGKVGLGVCWDRHRLYITRELARSGAEIVLMTVDDDFDGNPRFPPFHASDGVFRAVENRTTYRLGTTNGLSMVIDPYGRSAEFRDRAGHRRLVKPGNKSGIPGRGQLHRSGSCNPRPPLVSPQREGGPRRSVQVPVPRQPTRPEFLSPG